MRTKTIILPAFILLAIVQLFIPVRMIWQKEDTLSTGKEYKFKAAPIDPTDIFRGEYVSLYYDADTFRVKDKQEWYSGETIYILLSTDSLGFAAIQSVSRTKPQGQTDYIKAKVQYINQDKFTKLFIEYPFNKYYMEETKAEVAEQTYSSSRKDAYGLVSVKNGDAVLKDVIIRGKSIREIVKKRK